MNGNFHLFIFTRSTPFRPNNLNILVWKVSFPASSVNRYRVLVLSVIEHGNNSSHHTAATAIIQININKIEAGRNICRSQKSYERLKYFRVKF